MTLRWTDNIWQMKPTWPTDLYEVGSKHLFFFWHPADSRYCIGYFYGPSTKYGTDETTIHHELHFWFFSFNFVYTFHSGVIDKWDEDEQWANND